MQKFLNYRVLLFYDVKYSESLMAVQFDLDGSSLDPTFSVFMYDV